MFWKFQTQKSEQKKKQNDQDCKEEIKISLFADDMILYIEDLKYTTRKSLELINEYSKVAGYKIITHISCIPIHQYEKREREIKGKFPFTIAIKRIKYLKINLPKETKDLYIENYKTLMKEIKDDTDRWRNIPCSWIRIINVVNTTQNNLQIQCNPYQATNGIFQRTRTNNFTICMEIQKNLEQPKQS